MKPLRILHFADAHIDIANYGRHDPETALPMRVTDFLHSLDQIVDAAVAEQVDLVIFAGDAYKDRNPQPTFQREWGTRMMRLSQAGIPTLLLVGNHDLAPATGRAHTLQEFRTLAVPHVYVADRIQCWRPQDLGLDVQVITVPWVSRSRLMSREEMTGRTLDDVLAAMETRVAKAVTDLIATADDTVPLILTAHASVQGAVYGSERAVMLGQELVLSGNIVADRRLDYVALGHIHKHQMLSRDGDHPPIVYAGSIERIDFGEVREKKGYVVATVSKGKTEWEFRPLQTRRFVDLKIETETADTFMEDIMRQLPEQEKINDAICRVQLTYPRDWEPLLDEKPIAVHFATAFSLQIQKHRLHEKRARLGDIAAVERLSPLQLLEKYWQSIDLGTAEIERMQALAGEVFGAADHLSIDDGAPR